MGLLISYVWIGGFFGVWFSFAFRTVSDLFVVLSGGSVGGVSVGLVLAGCDVVCGCVLDLLGYGSLGGGWWLVFVVTLLWGFLFRVVLFGCAAAWLLLFVLAFQLIVLVCFHVIWFLFVLCGCSCVMLVLLRC